MKKIISLVITIVMMASMITACNNSTEPEISETSETTSTASLASDSTGDGTGETELSDGSEALESSVESEALESSVGSKTSASKTNSTTASPTGKTTPGQPTYKPKINKLIVHTEGRAVSENNRIGKWIEEKLGFKIELYYLSGTDTQKQIELMAAADTLPDIFTLGSGLYPLYNTLAKQGMLADLDPLIRQYAPNITKNRPWDLLNKLRYPDGKLYAINNNLETDFEVLLVRQDWLNKLNLKVPKTTDDLKNVLHAFVNNDPDGNGENDTMGLGCVNGIASFFGIFPAFNCNPGYWILNKSGKVVFGGAQQEVKDAIKYLRSLKVEGLLPNGWNTMDRSTLNQAVADGKVGVTMDQLWYISKDNAIYYNDPTAKWIALEPPVGPNGYSGYLCGNNPEVRRYTVISKKCKDPAAAMLYLNFLADYNNATTIRNGFEGIHWQYSSKTETGFEMKEPYKSDNSKLIADGVTSTYAWSFFLEDPIRAWCNKNTLDALAMRREHEKDWYVAVYETPDKVLEGNFDRGYVGYARGAMFRLINRGGDIDAEYQNCIDTLNANYRLDEITALYQEHYDQKKARLSK